ncbi:Ribonucleotide reductase R1 subunit, N-terminal,Ribonucleotide reductase large subunit, N- [Cinara cedri]|uniref:Ribonucleoside-diphosphate reductase n=1 Tax=Cinara cedri TaxID=506608 RepID=A0A5E4NE11_9HEMI|nr:Ribonucleotide reductase R1 subunit, N-terminal,Ribonucleotide reductase large subunit, N- [Cinara cedri]
MSNETGKAKLFVKKRDEKLEEVQMDKITSRIEKLCDGLNMDFIDPAEITLNVISDLCPGISTVQIDNLAAETAAYLTTKHPDFAVLAARIAISNLYKETKDKFSDVINDLYNMANERNQNRMGIISDFHYNVIMKHADRLNNAIKHDRDSTYSYFGFKTLEKSYLLKINNKVVERPQHLLMRVSIGIHGEDIDSAIETYDLMSLKYFTHASPTMFNAATPKPQLSSCFLVANKSDSLVDFSKSLKTCAKISKSAGGIGIHMHNTSAAGTLLNNYPKQKSPGLVTRLQCFNDLAQYVDQGGRRAGAIAVYIEPWHADIYTYTELRKNTGNKEEKTRDLFLALWIPDEFMRRVEADQLWSLMCPHKCPGLADVWGDDFVTLYKKYEDKKLYNRQVSARELWFRIITSQIETGMPYVLYKDACNAKSNQKNLGTIKCSNLCTEVIQYTSSDEVAVCNLASIAVNMFIKSNGDYDFEKLFKITKIVTKNLNKVIDVNFYPIIEAENSNKRHRPIGIGIQGLADLFLLMRYPFGSLESRKLNIQIFETLYYGALEASCELAENYGTYSSYQGSPISQGIFQFDMWNVKPTNLWNWDKLKEKITKYGVRNSLLLAPMPTASTAQILGNNESIEPYTTNLYYRRTLSGEFSVVNRHLLNDLIELNLWNEDMRNKLIYYKGSVQKIESIPDNIKELYKTNWELSQKIVLDMAADRAAFIDQSQSLNIHIEQPSIGKISSVHFYGWKKGLKTGMYYLRTRPAADPIQFTVNKSTLSNNVASQTEKNNSLGMQELVCSLENRDACTMCGA